MTNRTLPDPPNAPTSERVGLVHADLDAAIEVHRSVGSWGVLPITVTSFDELFAALPLTNHGGIGRAVFVPLGSEWLCYFNNWVGGTDAGWVCPVIAHRLHRRTIRVVLAERGSPYWPACIFETHNGDAGGPMRKWERMVGVMNDGGRWIFDLDGEPFPFEELDAYQRAKKRDRFTPEMLFRYLDALGVPRLTEGNLDFGRAVFLENLEMTPEARVTLTERDGMAAP
jgi:hypothetical protein